LHKADWAHYQDQVANIFVLSNKIQDGSTSDISSIWFVGMNRREYCYAIA